MKMGAVFPQTDFGEYDPGAVRDYILTIEALGYSHLIAYDHVLGANPDRPGGWKGAYTYESAFFEPFVLFSFASAIAPRLGYMTGILILPQRQTALVAKQASSLDIFCRGKFRLGVGLGWNEVEYTALNENFHNRGKRIEEQVELLRALWTQPLVKFQGKYHTIDDAGLKPLPVQKPIPIWFGGTVEEALKRIARIADGWLPNVKSAEIAKPMVEVVRKEMERIGRDPATLGIEPRLVYGDGNPEAWRSEIRQWQELGATQFSINTLGRGFTTPTEHLNALRNFASAVGPFGE
jgi:probable F420-dependent oxidoreductase